MNTDSHYLRAPKIMAWKQSILNAGCTIHSLTPLHLYHKPNGELLFALLSVDITSPDGEKLPSLLFLRGHATIIVPLVINKETGHKRYLMVQQRRIVNGEISLEFPAGMLDCNIHEPKKVAITEMLEETGMNITAQMLFPLSDSVLYCSPGATDEGIYYFGCIIRVDNTIFQSIEGQLHGKPSENERISITLKTRIEAEKQCTSLPARFGFYLFEQYCSLNNLQILNDAETC